ncbi:MULTISPECIES: methyl-accepting chemotaxis protein [Aquincola]|uniref:methyl-accepting chemotaxis protein n=1 Tax=Aquincola TaxID=391952 RepID=UPI0006153C13|nr:MULTISPECIES: methyl-accepting chemotaxis protein [Aquincola]MCR5863701.1 methyl-accepting chemotaxis protein [Aquincola sp. J276]
MFLSSMSIGKRLAVVLGVILSLCFASSLFAVVKLRHIGQHVDKMVTDNARTERATADWLRNTTAGVQRAAAIAKSSDSGLIEYFAPATAASIAETNKLQEQIDKAMRTPEERKLFDEVGAMRKAYLAARAEVSKLKQAGDLAGASKLFDERFEPTAKAYLAGVTQIADLQRSYLDQAAAQSAELTERTASLLVACAVLATGLGVVLAWLLAGSITRPLREAEKRASAIAQMDLTGQPQARYASDETGQLLRAIDAMRSALQQALGQVRGVVDSISTASSEIATGNHDLSARTEQAASNLQQTASSMEELTATVHQSADMASQVNQLAASAVDAARRGGQVVSQVVSTMEEIHSSSRKVADITGTIDGIAFQTNILALNAAVEAARAGEQGRGFAVVAGEVRLLAQRSAEAAREIKALIGASVDKVEHGTRLVQEAGGTMEDVVTSAQRVTDMIGEVTVATAEQRDGIGQVNGAVSQLDQMTQQNAALVEQSTAATTSLQEQAQRLAGVVAGFRLQGR